MDWQRNFEHCKQWEMRISMGIIHGKHLGVSHRATLLNPSWGWLIIMIFPNFHFIIDWGYPSFRHPNRNIISSWLYIYDRITVYPYYYLHHIPIFCWCYSHHLPMLVALVTLCNARRWARMDTSQADPNQPHWCLYLCHPMSIMCIYM